MTVILTCIFAACDKTNVDDEKHTKQVPVYKGMTISDSFAGTSATVASDDNGNHYGHFKGDHNDRNDEVDQNKPFEDPNAPSIENKANSTLDVVGAAESIYYADKNQDIFITIRLSNPDSYEILSFTLNGKKYSNYMFENGSDMENLVLKVNVGDVGGIVEYTIDAIKYVDGTDIKDVRMDGDRTVKAGVRASDQTYVNVTNEQKTMTSISFDAQVVDLYSLIEKSGGYAKAVLYDGVNMLTKDINVGEKTNIVFDNLTPNTVYQYGVVALYDNLSGNGAKLNTLYKKAVYTDTIVLFKDVQVGKECIEWGFVWNESFDSKQMSAISLWQNGAKVQDVDTGATRIDGLKSNNEYTLEATYKNLQNQDETISIEFVTYAKAVPTVEIANLQSTQTEVSFELNVTDTDNVGTIAKIELLHGDDEPIVASDLTSHSFENLLSNNDYTIQVTYVYDLNDGVGEQQIVKTTSITTKAKAVPTVEIVNAVATKKSIRFGINVVDKESVGAISKIELLHENAEPITAENLDVREFSGLLCDNNYTIRVTYSYDVNDGKGVQLLYAEKTIKTESKTMPTARITSDPMVYGTKGNFASFDYETTDVDNVGYSKVVLIRDGKDDASLVFLNGEKVFENLYNNSKYILRLVYVYDMDDGKGERELVDERTFMTMKLTHPSIWITNLAPTKDGAVYDAQMSDTYSFVSCRFECVADDAPTVVIEDFMQDSITLSEQYIRGLLSNHDYKVNLIIRYDLNEGDGEKEFVFRTFDLKTNPRMVPSVSLPCINNAGNKIASSVDLSDRDNTYRGIDKVELCDGDRVIATSTDENFVFEGIDNFSQSYTIKVTYIYDLCDGLGEQKGTTEFFSPRFSLGETACVNTGAVSKGEKLYFEASIENPSKIAIDKVKINDTYYSPSKASTVNNIVVDIEVGTQFASGYVQLLVTELQGTLNGQHVTITPNDTNDTKCYFAGELNVKSISVADAANNTVDRVVLGKQYYYKCELGNELGYSIDEILISVRKQYYNIDSETYSKDQIIVDSDSCIRVPFLAEDGIFSVEVSKISYSNELLSKNKNVTGITIGYIGVANEEPIVISNAEDLRKMNTRGYYILSNDIDLKGIEWKDPGDFYGYLDGQGYTIKNMAYAGTVENAGFNWGLFNNASGVIKNLTLNGRLIITVNKNANESYTSYIGGLCAQGSNLTIDNVINNVNLTVTNNCNSISIGGLVGDVSGMLEISNSKNFGNIAVESSGYAHVGGIIGRCLDVASIANCYNTGDVSLETYSKAYGYVGGIVGGAYCRVDLNDCYNTGTVTASSEASDSHGYAGGLVGCTSDCFTNIYNSYNGGNVTAIDSAGGLVGTAGSTVNIVGCYNEGSVHASENAGGIIGYSQSILTITNCYNNANITSDSAAGGLVGCANGDNTTIELSHNDGTVTVITTNGYAVAAGLIARIGTSSLTITDSYNTGTITSKLSSLTSSANTIVAAGLVGSCSYGDYVSTIVNSYNTGEILSDDIAGGLVGYGGKVEINNSRNLGNVKTGGRSGGLVGYGSTVIITNSYNNGDVATTSDTNSVYAGGLVCYGDNITVERSFNEGIINVTTKDGTACAGGIVASGSNTQIISSYNLGTVTIAVYRVVNAGGLIGIISGNSDIKNSFNSGTVEVSIKDSGNTNIGGIIGLVNDGVLSIANSFNKEKVIYNYASDSYKGWGLVGYNNYGAKTTISYCYNSSAAPGLVYNSGNITVNNSYYTVSNGNYIQYGEKKSINRIIEIFIEVWDSTVWDFDNLDENGNPTLKI